MNVKPLHNTRSLQSTGSGLIQTKHSRRSPCTVTREFKRDDQPDAHAGTPPSEALKVLISIAANHKPTFSIKHVDVSLANFHAKVQRLVLIRLPVEDRMGADSRNIGLLKKSMKGTRNAPSNFWSVIGKNMSKSEEYQLCRSSKTLFRKERNQVSGMTHGDNLMFTGPIEC